MRKILNLLFGLSFLFSASVLNAQVCGYTFSQTSGTYTEITGGQYTHGNAAGTGGYWDDAATGSLDIGFTFNYAGTNYTNFVINPNGYISFPGTNSPGALSAILCNQSYINIISAYTDDLYYTNACASGGQGAISYLTSGTAPNRVLTVQWKNAGRYANTLLCANFQIKLFETTNNIQILYGPYTVSSSYNHSVQVGLRGTAACDFLVRQVSNGGSWDASTAGNQACATSYVSNTVKPSNGLTYTFAYGTATCASCCPPSNTSSN